MNIRLIPLNEWIEWEYRSYKSMTQTTKINETSSLLGVSESTLRRWLKDGEHYVEEISSSTCGDDSAIVLWKAGKAID